MKSLINEYVEHMKFGRGLIVKEDTGKITVEFVEQIGNKMFLFPDAFELFLKLEDNSLQEDCLLLLQNKKQLIAQENEKKHLEEMRLEEVRRIEGLEKKKKSKKPSKVKETVKQAMKKVSKTELEE